MKVTNKYGGPFDIQTANGPRVIGAYETIDADFTADQIEMMKLSTVLELGGDEKLPEPVIMKEPVAPDGEIETTEKGEPDGSVETLRLLYADRFGKEPDKRWGEVRLRKELDED